MTGFGLIGCGAIADVHLKAMADTDGARIVEVASRDRSKAQQTGERFGCSWTTDYTQLLKRPDIDVVCVCTSSGSHGSIGRDVLKAGKHLIVEKPIAMTAAEASAMIELARQSGLVLSVISQSRFNEHHRLVKQVLEEGRLGKLLLLEISRPYYRDQSYYDSADWRGTLAEDGGALMNQGIHSIDLLLWMAGKVSSVIGRVATQTHRMEAEDIGLALLTFQSGAFASVMCSTSMVPGYDPTFHLYGEQGSIKIEGTRIVHWSVPGVPLPDLDHLSEAGSSASNPRNVSHTYHKQQIMDVIGAIREGRPPAVTGEDGRDAVRLIELIYASSASEGKAMGWE
ncbi:Gfo/Idh/MocA family oxidoreductase [Paenibacillus aurantius]|uniref:Gfo/Idh/MocA family oxidoreductase n=1 Tax=Paenibacillus aurantius TaxID=2918900 RepID=A0AA96LI69_9BACL|nr:Gfo/Idh/MocA family oxidoreductase [Paenibacillus aurantius]WNQ12406.1 Gfo/Idh/MocA family oxidoreductase [Paenibacillus aurantius]